MFEPSLKPRIFALPVGCDFLAEFKDGLVARLASQSPEAIARVTVYLNTERSVRRLNELFVKDGPGFLPKIKTLSALAKDPTAPICLPPAGSKFSRLLSLSHLVEAFLEAEPQFAPLSAKFELAQSLGALMSEMQGEDVRYSELENLDISEHSLHWDRSKKFLQIVGNYWHNNDLTDQEDRARQVAEAFCKKWQHEPINDPIIVAGSTGSRGETATFIKAVAGLPQGAVVLPGFDFDMPKQVWQNLRQPESNLDHPQAGFSKLLAGLNTGTDDVGTWRDVVPSSRARNKMISLVLRPAPITDAWRSEGPALEQDLPNATKDIDLIEADTGNQEALAIAVRLRKAAEDNERAVLISPDRSLTRRVEAVLLRWGIVADDSAGKPLHLTAPGIFLRLVVQTMTRDALLPDILTLLKHPLTCAESSQRNKHLLRTRELELKFIRGKGKTLDFAKLKDWAKKQTNDTGALAWVDWYCTLFETPTKKEAASLSEWVTRHRDIANALSAGNAAQEQPEIWEQPAGRKCFELLQALGQESDEKSSFTAAEYQQIFELALRQEEVREPAEANPLISVWGTLEARVQGADLVILGGLNEGIWPKAPAADAWLNRAMRKELGLLTPDRNIGLSAHDFQQAIGAPKVVLSRALRDADATTVASRWLIRLKNFLAGLDPASEKLLNDMSKRGDYWIGLSNKLDRPTKTIPPEPRPAPSPPVEVRPRELWATQVKTLIRDPYSIYARHILKLRPLDGLYAEPDERLRGSVFHLILEKYCSQPSVMDKDAFVDFANAILEKEVPWVAARRVWLAKLSRFADWFLPQEAKHRAKRSKLFSEASGSLEFKNLDFKVSARADRIDLQGAGGFLLDYKTGKAPSQKEIENFDKQIPLTALILEAGGFDELGAQPVDTMAHISLANDGEFKAVNRMVGKGSEKQDLVSLTKEGLVALIEKYRDEELGYIARDRPQFIKDRYKSDYDQLSRFGEWQDSSEPKVIFVK